MARKRTLAPSATDSYAYRGYLIRWSNFSQRLWVEKESFHICWAADIADATAKIDELLS